jgi:ATP-dependent Lon protease
VVENQLRGSSAEGTGSASPTLPPLPADALIIVPVRNTVLFPGVVLPITIGRQRSVAAAQQAVREQRPVGILMQRNAEAADPLPIDMHRMGTVANIARYITAPDGTHHLVCQGEQRFQIIEFLNGWPFFVARVLRISEPAPVSDEIEARFVYLKGQAVEAVQLLPQAPPELLAAIQAVDTPTALADMVATYMDATPEEKQDILETIDIKARMERVSRILAHRIKVLRLSQEIGRETRAALDARNREVLLREQMAAIQRQLGEGDEGKSAEIAELGEAITKAKMPKEVEDQARKELRRLQRMPEAAGEYGMVRTYLDWLVELPWSLPEETPIDIVAARRILDEDHFGLEKIKRRIIEYLAVRKLAPNGKAPILCFVGPPGVGKTSLGQSIARAMNRKFVRVSLGGVHDEAEIRGHRRTYIGALPGNIIQTIRKAGTRNCVMMLDEIDKLGTGIHGDPGAALLEVLDPEQNSTFRDNYLAVPFDLSRVVFITTANMLDTIPGPLRDRMEIISLAGYTAEEKLEIARRYLVGRQMEANGLRPGQVEIADEALREIIQHYTREAGVRNLEREIGKVLRHAAVRIAEGQGGPIRIAAGGLAAILGAPLFENEAAMRTSVPGVRNRPRLDSGRRRHPLHRGDRQSGARQTDPHRSARRGDAGKRPGGVEHRQEPGGIAGDRNRPIREDRYPHPCAGGRDTERRTERRSRDVHGSGFAIDGSYRAQRHGHDRRDQPARTRTPGRRHQGEGRGCAAGRHQARDAAGAEPEGLRGHSRAGSPAAGIRLD